MGRLLLAGIIVTIVGVGASLSSVYNYISHPLALNSSSGLVVFRQQYTVLDDPRFSLVQYLPFEWGFEPAIVGVGAVLVVASIVMAASLWSTGRPILRRR